MYADDTVLFANDAEGLQKVLDNLKKRAVQNGSWKWKLL